MVSLLTSFRSGEKKNSSRDAKVLLVRVIWYS